MNGPGDEAIRNAPRIRNRFLTTRSRHLSAAQVSEDSGEIVRLCQDVTGLGSLARLDDAPALHEVHEAARLGEADPELALEHRGGAELGRDDQFGGLDQQVE